MKTKEKVKYWLDKYPSLRDDDNRLSANIWGAELLRRENFLGNPEKGGGTYADIKRRWYELPWEVICGKTTRVWEIKECRFETIAIM